MKIEIDVGEGCVQKIIEAYVSDDGELDRTDSEAIYDAMDNLMQHDRDTVEEMSWMVARAVAEQIRAR